MPSRDRRYDTVVNMNQTTRRPRVSVCTSAQVFNIQAFIDVLLLKYTDIVSDVRYFELPYNDIDHFSFRNKGIDVMILCHSINNRRFAITDVTDALYDEFLPNAVRALGKTKICVLVHDFRADNLDTVEKYRNQMDAFLSKQPTTFKCANLIMVGGKLDEKVELGNSQWEELRAFLMDASQSPEHIPGIYPYMLYDLVNSVCQNIQRSPKYQVFLVVGVLIIGLIIVLLTVLVDSK
ncbi:uncharacterized protein LOC129256126 [Lytechinus pictus]|uniref:uncharacterized protein LOC129256126 n=1 Tax=Lytechinus pictus TaxID=7653 RepID=UPI00240CE60C|nr:uncharacterized protein LOC129256126 [Lytechinus pictus]